MKPLTLVLLVLVGSMILTSISSQVYADPQLDSLLRIANQARDNIKIRLSQLPTIPDEIAKLYKEGSAETNALAKSITKEDVSSSRQHFLSAMKLFRDVSNKMHSLTPDISTPPSPDTTRYKKAIDRMEKDGEMVKALATKYNLNIDFTKFDNLIQIARQHLNTGNLEEVTNTLEIAKQFLIHTHNSIKDVVKQKPSDRDRSNTANEIPSTPQTSDEAISAKDSKLERIKTKIQTIEEQLNSLSEKVGENEVAAQWLKRAFSLVEKAKGELDKSPDKAMRTLNEIDKIIRMIQRIAQ